MLIKRQRLRKKKQLQMSRGRMAKSPKISIDFSSKVDHQQSNSGDDDLSEGSSGEDSSSEDKKKKK